MSTSTTPGRARRPGRWIIAGLVIIVVLVVGGPFVYIHFIEGKAPAALSLRPERGGSGAPAAPGSLSGNWSITDGSLAGFRVHEDLFGQQNTAVGRTSVIDGSFTLSGTTVESGSFKADLQDEISDESERDSAFRGRVMDTSQYPYATFTLTRPIGLGTLPSAGRIIDASATGKLTLKDTTKAVTIPLTAELTGKGTIEVQGSLNIVFSDWGIENPSFGPVTTDSNGIMEFLLVFAHGAPTATTTTTTTVVNPLGPNGGSSQGGNFGPFGGGSPSTTTSGQSSTSLTTIPALRLNG